MERLQSLARAAQAVETTEQAVMEQEPQTLERELAETYNLMAQAILQAQTNRWLKTL